MLENLEPELRKQRVFHEWLPLTKDGFVVEPSSASDNDDGGFSPFAVDNR